MMHQRVKEQVHQVSQITNREAYTNQMKFQLLYSLGHNPQKACHFLVNVTYDVTARQQRQREETPTVPKPYQGSSHAFLPEKCPSSTAIFTPPKPLSTRSYLLSTREQLLVTAPAHFIFADRAVKYCFPQCCLHKY